MKRLYPFLASCLWIIVFFCACKDENNTPDPDPVPTPDPVPELKLEVSDTVFSVGMEASVQKLKIATDASWTVTGNNDWCKAVPVKGNASAEISITLGENQLGSAREHVLTVTATDDAKKTVTRNVRFTQTSRLEMISFGFKKEQNPGIEKDLNFNFSALRPGKDADTLFFNVSYLINNLKLCPAFTFRGNCVKVGDRVQESQVTKVDFGISQEYRVVATDETERKYVVVVQHFTGLPIVYINTENGAPIVSKDNYLNATVRIEENRADGSGILLEVPTEVKGRGNSTWGMAKKPYKLKFNKKSEVLGMPADKEWVLLANYIDPSLVRNDLAFEISERLGMAWTPRRIHVELVLNGVHRGNYLLTEQIKISPDRVDVEDLKATETSPDVITGGYLLELDTYYDEDWKFKSAVRNLPFMVKEPKIAQPHLDYLVSYIADVENTIYGADFKDPENGWKKYIDEDSFIDWWIINETMGCWEPNHPKSSYMHKDRNGKLFMGPVWDFDWKEYGWQVDRFYMKGANNTTMPIWYARLFEDTSFLNKLKTRYKTLRSGELSNLGVYLGIQKKKLQKSAELNYNLWRQGSSNYNTEMNAQLNFITGHLNWLDINIPKL